MSNSRRMCDAAILLRILNNATIEAYGVEQNIETQRHRGLGAGFARNPKSFQENNVQTVCCAEGGMNRPRRGSPPSSHDHHQKKRFMRERRRCGAPPRTDELYSVGVLVLIAAPRGQARVEANTPESQVRTAD